jgi:hypothetical protein
MTEHGETTIRRVRRKLVDSTLPKVSQFLFLISFRSFSFKTWEPSDQNCKRITLQSSSPEYQDVLAQFHVTMLGKYSQIIKIERIQNERWYKQVKIISNQLHLVSLFYSMLHIVMIFNNVIQKQMNVYFFMDVKVNQPIRLFKDVLTDHLLVLMVN